MYTGKVYRGATREERFIKNNVCAFIINCVCVCGVCQLLGVSSRGVGRISKMKNVQVEIPKRTYITLL